MANSTSSLDAWTPSGTSDDLKVLSELTERSLKEVKALTEYEDTKAQRILTAIAFLAALAGAMFTVASRSVQELKPFSSGLDLGSVNAWIAITVYSGFGLYSALLAIGATLVIYAVKPKFNIPPEWGSTPSSG